MKTAFWFVFCCVCSCIKSRDSNRFWLHSGWRPPRTNRLPELAADPVLTHFPFVSPPIWSVNSSLQYTHNIVMDRKDQDVRIMKNTQCLPGRDFSKLMECPLCWDRMMVMDEWKGKIRTTIWSLDNNDVTSADACCLWPSGSSSRVLGTGERDILDRITHLHF